MNQRRVREESQLDDMRAAIRGDFERLAERRGGQELMHVRDPEPEPAVEAPPEPEPEVEPEPVAAVAEHDEEPAATPDEPSKRSFWARLFGL